MSRRAPSNTVELAGALIALSLSPDEENVVTGGRDDLSVVSIKNGVHLQEAVNLRQSVKNRSLQNTTVDVQWHPAIATRIATSARNGSIVIWNPFRQTGEGGKQDFLIEKVHDRTVNRLRWHPVNHSQLLTASQDNTLALLDVTKPPEGAKLPYKTDASILRYKFEQNSEPVRDVGFSPSFPTFFAAAFDNGDFKLFDTRELKMIRSITGHKGPVHCLDWPKTNENFFATGGGRDNTVKVWDLRTMQPYSVIEVPDSVWRIQWHPERKRQLAVSAKLFDSNIYVWDFETPEIPIKQYSGHREPTTGLAWLTKQGTKLLSCSMDKTLILHDEKSAYYPYRYIRTSSLAVSPGEVIASITEDVDRVTVEGPKADDWSVRKDQERTLYIFPHELRDALTEDAIPSTEVTIPYLHDKYRKNRLSGMSSKESFLTQAKHNMAAAKSMGLLATTHSWRVLIDAVEDTGLPSEVEATVTKVASDEQQSRSTLFQEPPGYSFQSMMTPDLHSNFSAGPHNDIFENALSSFSGSGKMSAEWDRSAAELDVISTVKAILDYSVSSGDIQMCYFLSELTEAHGVSICPLSQRKAWEFMYMEILKRFGDFVGAAQLVKESSIEDVSKIGLTSTSIGLKCTSSVPVEAGNSTPVVSVGGVVTLKRCGGMITPTTGVRCSRCLQVSSTCALCRRPCRGEYVWCQGCGHGGHIACLREWFTEEADCPSGCGHSCLPYGILLRGV